MKNNFKSLFLILCLSLSFLAGCSNTTLQDEVNLEEFENKQETKNEDKLNVSIDENATTPYIEVNNNIPYFTDKEKQSLEPFEKYSDLDNLGRCGVAYANVCKELMPTEKRGEIGQVKPSGWHTIKYDCVDGKYLYNRCHLIGYQLTGENANEKNLITGTRYLNIEGMLPFENMVADYVKETNNHVLYRVTPKFDGNNLLCNGVLMEGYSVEDNGEGISFCIFAYNIQPNITIDYSTGDSQLKDNTIDNEKTNNVIEETEPSNEEYYNLILNTSTKKYHKENCSLINKMSEKNKETYNGTLSWLNDNGYTPCGRCFN